MNHLKIDSYMHQLPPYDVDCKVASSVYYNNAPSKSVLGLTLGVHCLVS